MLWGLLSFKQHLLFGRSKSKPPRSRSQAESASVGFGGGHARANPQEAEIRPKVLRRGLAVDMPGQTPGKQKSSRKCFGGVWRWTCQSKPPGSRNQAQSASAGFGGGHATANPREAEIRPKAHVHPGG